MTKAILEYDLDDLEDANDYEIAMHSRRILVVLYTFDERLRNILKHGHRDYDDEEGPTIEKLRDELRVLCEDYNVDLSMLL